MFEGSVPYLIIVVLFFRGITLDGAEKGIKFYLSEPDFSHVFKLEVCFLFFQLFTSYFEDMESCGHTCLLHPRYWIWWPFVPVKL
jgi:SNF family Na+-dependent transporter